MALFNHFLFSIYRFLVIFEQFWLLAWNSVRFVDFYSGLTSLLLFWYMKQKVQLSTNATFFTPKMGKTGKNFPRFLIQNFVGNILFEMMYGAISCLGWDISSFRSMENSSISWIFHPSKTWNILIRTRDNAIHHFKKNVPHKILNKTIWEIWPRFPHFRSKEGCFSWELNFLLHKMATKWK